MTHWRTFYPSKYLGSEDLHEAGVSELNVLIEKVQLEIITGADNRKDNKGVMYLKGLKPMIVNVTNCKMIAKVLGTAEVEEWGGKSVIVYIEKINYRGDIVDALRIKPTAPAPAVLPELTEAHARYVGALTAMQNGSVTIEQIEANYTLSPEIKAKLIAPAPVAAAAAPVAQPPVEQPAQTVAEMQPPVVPVPEAGQPAPIAPVAMEPLKVVNGQTTATAEASLPVLNEQHPNWESTRSVILKGLTTIEAVQKQYFVSAEDLLKLTVPALPGKL